MADPYKVQYSPNTVTNYGHQGGVVTAQPVGGVIVRPQKRDWSTGVFNCFDDMKICLCGLCCPLCLSCQVSQDLGEHFLAVPCCVPNFLNVLRSQFRTQQGIQGTVCNDCLCVSFCGNCVLCQLKREIETCKANGTLNNPNP